MLERHNKRFAVPAAEPVPAWRSWPEGLGSAAVFCFQYPHRVGRDNTVSWPSGNLAALPRRSDGRSWAGRTVILQERLDGSLWVSHDALCVPVRPAPAAAGQLRARRLTPPSDRDLPAELARLIEADAAPAPEPPGDLGPCVGRGRSVVRFHGLEADKVAGCLSCQKDHSRHAAQLRIDAVVAPAYSKNARSLALGKGGAHGTKLYGSP